MKNVYNKLINAIKEKNMKVIRGIPNSNIGKNFIVVIEQGFYNPTQMVTELTNKFNNSVTLDIIIYFNSIFINIELKNNKFKYY